MFGLKLIDISKSDIKLASEIQSFAQQLEKELESDTAKIISGMFPEGNAVDDACIALCKDAIVAAKAMQSAAPTLQNVQTHINGIFTKLQVDIASIKNGTQKHNLGYYLRCVGMVIEDIAAGI